MSYENTPVHIDRALANYALTYENKKLIADLLSPVVQVANKSDVFYQKPKSATMKYVGQPIVGLTTPVPEVESDFTTASYACQGYGYQSKVAIELQNNADVPLNLREEAALDAMALLMIAREIRVRDLVFNTANYAVANSTTVVNKWENDANDPIVQIEAMRDVLWTPPQGKLIAVMGYAAWARTKNNAKVLSRVGGGSTTDLPAMVSRTKFAELIEADEFVVGEGWMIDANGTQTRIWGKDFAMIYVSESPSTRSMTFTQTMRWSEVGPGGIGSVRWVDPAVGLNGVERNKITHADAEVIAAPDAGFLMKAVVT